MRTQTILSISKLQNDTLGPLRDCIIKGVQDTQAIIRLGTCLTHFRNWIKLYLTFNSGSNSQQCFRYHFEQNKQILSGCLLYFVDKVFSIWTKMLKYEGNAYIFLHVNVMNLCECEYARVYYEKQKLKQITEKKTIFQCKLYSIWLFSFPQRLRIAIGKSFILRVKAISVRVTKVFANLLKNTTTNIFDTKTYTWIKKDWHTRIFLMQTYINNVRISESRDFARADFPAGTFSETAFAARFIEYKRSFRRIRRFMNVDIVLM